MRHATLLLTFVLLTTTFPFARSDPGGGDAPEDWSSALTVPAGDYVGTVGPWPSDRHDWLRVEHPEGMGVRIRFGATGDVYLTARTEDGRFLRALYVDGARPPSLDVSWTLAGEGAVRIGVEVLHESASYDLRLEIVPIADIAVLSVKVEDVPRCVAFSEDEPCLVEAKGSEARVSVDLANLGLLPYEGILRVSAQTPTLPVNPAFYQQAFRLSPGASLTLYTDWDPRGIGTVDVHAVAIVPGGDWLQDAAPLNDRARTSYTILSPAPVGVAAPPLWL